MTQLENVRKLFRTEEIETTAIDNVDITVEPGEFVSIMGLRLLVPRGC